MDDLISRQDAMRVYQDVCSHVTCKECSMYNGDGEICRIEEWLKALPSAQPERKKGKKNVRHKEQKNKEVGVRNRLQVFS